MRNFAAAAAFLGAFAFATPGPLAQQNQAHQHGESPKAGQAQQKGEFDLRFLDMTAMHHEMGLKMSQTAQLKAENSELKAKATEMAQEQRREIDEIDRLRSKLYPDAPKRQGISDMQHGMGSMHGAETSGQSGTGHQHEGQSMGAGGMQMEGMEKAMAQMNRLEKLRGAEFDQAFAKNMIQHHQMQVRVSERALKDAKHDEVRDLAKETLTSQNKDIADLRRFAGSAK